MFYRLIVTKGTHALKEMNRYGFMVVTAISHQGTSENMSFLSGRILLLISLLAGMNVLFLHFFILLQKYLYRRRLDSTVYGGEFSLAFVSGERQRRFQIHP